MHGETCESRGLLSGFLACDSMCQIDASGCFADNSVCGDAKVTGLEECDGRHLDGQTCSTLGFDSGILQCGTDCRRDTSGCGRCGNRVLDGDERCDGNRLSGQSCLTQGFSSGTLACDSACEFEVSGCATCGNGTIEAGENCDGSLLAGASCESLGLGVGTLTCSPTSCHYDSRACAECRANANVCVPGMNAYEICGLDGVLANQTNCVNMGTSYFEVCRSGACVESTEDPYGFNVATGTGWSAVTFNAGQWRVMSIDIPAAVRLFSLNATLSGVTLGSTSIRMALWDQRMGSTALQPGEVVAQSTGQAAVEGVNSLNIAARPLLQAGRYWLGINLNLAAQGTFRTSGSSKYTFQNVTYSVDPKTNSAWTDGDADNKREFPNVTPANGDYSLYIRAKATL